MQKEEPETKKLKTGPAGWEPFVIRDHTCVLISVCNEDAIPGAYVCEDQLNDSERALLEFIAPAATNAEKVSTSILPLIINTDDESDKCEDGLDWVIKESEEYMAEMASKYPENKRIKNAEELISHAKIVSKHTPRRFKYLTDLSEMNRFANKPGCATFYFREWC